MRPAPSVLALALLLSVLGACARFLPWHPPEGPLPPVPATPRLSLLAKAEAYQLRIDALHAMPDGVIRYRVRRSQDRGDYGDLPDGPFFAGLYLASQALRLAATGDAAAHAEIERTLDGMALLMDVTGRPGLLARWVSRDPSPPSSRWHRSETRPGYWWRGDVSKDQLAGYACGLGVALAVLPSPALEQRIASLAGPLAEHLDSHDLTLVDVDGRRTSHGDLQPRVFGFPVGVNALIALAVAKDAEASGAGAALWQRLLGAGALDVAGTAHWRAPGNTKRVNENMAYVSLLPLLLLERDPERARTLREAEARLWEKLSGEHNAFFAFVHALASGDGAAREEGIEALREFPDRKRDLPVDLTPLDLPRSFWKSSKGEPRARDPLPLYLRPAGSSLWVNDPRLLVGSLGDRGETEYAGIDFLLAYWLARQQHFIVTTEGEARRRHAERPAHDPAPPDRS
jgi:hypothetical protein